MQQDAGIVAAGMAEHIESAVEQFREGDWLQNQAQPVIPVVVIGAFLTLLDEQRQTFPDMIQAGHRREGVIDRRRHGAYRHFDQLVDRVGDILGGGAPVSNPESLTDLSIQLLIHPSGGPDQGDPRLAPDKVTRLAQQADDQVLFLSQGQHVIRINVLDVSCLLHPDRIAVLLRQGVGADFRLALTTITARDLRDLGENHLLQLCARRGGDIGGLQHGADMLDEQDQRGKGRQ